MRLRRCERACRFAYATESRLFAEYTQRVTEAQLPQNFVSVLIAHLTRNSPSRLSS
jgi:hypothetical protein